MEEYQTQPASRACSFPPPRKLGGIQEQIFMNWKMESEAQAMGYWSQELETLLRHCRKHRQRSRMTTLDMLEVGFDPKLHRGQGRDLA